MFFVFQNFLDKNFINLFKTIYTFTCTNALTCQHNFYALLFHKQRSFLVQMISHVRKSQTWMTSFCTRFVETNGLSRTIWEHAPRKWCNAWHTNGCCASNGIPSISPLTQNWLYRRFLSVYYILTMLEKNNKSVEKIDLLSSGKYFIL